MKKQSGQWMTFSHMANHYRKLLNVKPRVDTGVPKYSVTTVSAKQSSKQLKGPNNSGGSNGKLPKSTLDRDRERPSTGTVERISSKTKAKSSRPKMASRMIDYEYHALSKGLMKSPNGSFNTGSSSDGYQVVFGPSSIKSSVDAMISDPDLGPEVLEPKLSSISIGEKIRKFLDHIHAQEAQSQHKIGGRSLPGSRERREPSIRNHPSKEQLAESRHSRHSKCFTPFEVPTDKGTKKRCVKSAEISQKHPLPRSPQPQQLRPLESRKNLNNVAKDSPTKLSTLIKNNKKSKHINNNTYNKSPFQEMLTSLKHSANNNNNNNTNKSTKRLSKMKSSSMSPTLSPRSVSVGTIRGSDELTDDFLLPSSSVLQRHMSTSTIQIDTGDMPTDWLKDRVERGVVRINNAYFSLAPGTSTSSLGITMLPNKDSSRDSAYGFSSGESRITTRESTPEKKSKSPRTKAYPHASAGGSSTHPNSHGNGTSYSSESNHNHHGTGNTNGKYKSSLSTVASSINQDRSSSNGRDVDVDVDSSGHSSASEKSILHHFPQRSSTSYEELLMEQKYIEFLTSVTDDIVIRGIYTNKGIKNIFKSHLMRSSDLEMDKMLCLLERLRIDMGVPKDDSLNQLDFGYGSVDYSAGPYFYDGCQDAVKSSTPQQLQLQMIEQQRSGQSEKSAPPDDPEDPEELLSFAAQARKLSYTIEHHSVDTSSSELNIE